MKSLHGQTVLSFPHVQTHEHTLHQMQFISCSVQLQHNESQDNRNKVLSIESMNMKLHLQPKLGAGKWKLTISTILEKMTKS